MSKPVRYFPDGEPASDELDRQGPSAGALHESLVGGEKLSDVCGEGKMQAVRKVHFGPDRHRRWSGKDQDVGIHVDHQALPGNRSRRGASSIAVSISYADLAGPR